jgi:hypothetical protein
LEWHTAGSNYFESGIDQGVLYVDGYDGVPWNGLISVTESSSGGDAQPYYIDGYKYANRTGDEEFEATIEAYTYPDLFMKCDGTEQPRPGLFITQQRRLSFGLSYRTLVGNEVNSDHGYKIHLVYNALVSPSEHHYETQDNSPKPMTFSWGITTRPTVTTGYKPTAHIIIDTRTTDPKVVRAIEDFIYGSNLAAPALPTFEQILDLYDTPEFLVTDHGDGTYTVIAPDFAITDTGGGTYSLTWPTAVPIDADTYTISSP